MITSPLCFRDGSLREVLLMSSLATGFATFPDPLAVSDLEPAPVPRGLVDDITFGPLVLQVSLTTAQDLHSGINPLYCSIHSELAFLTES